jgi:1,4-dihydroxy-2-naphthoyl-CoA hydrolase
MDFLARRQMSIWKRPITLEKAAQSRAGTMMDHLGIELVALGDDFLSAKMPVDHRTRQPYGIMHGGASCVLAETVGSIAAYYCTEEGRLTVGIEINTSHIRKVSEGYVTGTAKPLHLGSTSQVWEILIRDDKGQLISASRLRVAILQP